MVVIIPGALFIFFGGQISIEAITKFINHEHIEHEIASSPISLAVWSSHY